MKKIVYTLIIAFITVNVHAQLNNTKWKTTFQLDQTVDVVFNFNNDTLEVTNLQDNSSLETMKYTLKDTVLTFKKIYGQSDCDSSQMGTYSCKVAGDVMSLMLISDDCTHRSAILKDIKLNKQE